MITDIGQARDEMLAQFQATWVAADWPTLVGSATPVYVEWDGLDDGKPLDPGVPFARVTIRHKANPQVTFRGPFQQKRRFTATGLVAVQVFTPVSRIGLALSEKLAIIAQSAFLGVTPNGVWFQNVVGKEIGPDGTGFYQWNVNATFSYDTLA